jgi:predicted metal-dependent phosphoesterase TrpH
VDSAIEAGLDKIAITDHGEINGAVEAHARYPERVIVGEEIHCRGGTHLIGLFLSDRISYGLSIRDTADRIRDQGGVVYAPHPYAYLTRATSRANEVLDVADIVEVFNSRAFLPRWNRRAATAAGKRGLPVAASSDSHFPRELGRGYTEMPEFNGAGEFLESAKQARSVGIRVGSPWLHVGSKLLAEARALRRWAVGSLSR